MKHCLTCVMRPINACFEACREFDIEPRRVLSIELISMFGREFDREFGREFGRAFGREFGREFDREFGREFGRKFGRKFDIES